MIEGLREIAGRHVGDMTVPGLVALVAHGDHVDVEAFGRLAIGGPPVARDSLFRVASISKPITAAATLALIEEGLLGLDDTVDTTQSAEEAAVHVEGEEAIEEANATSGDEA